MTKPESLADFYQAQFNWLPDNVNRDTGHVNVFRLEDCIGAGKIPLTYNRRDFYKVTLIRGDNLYHYADKSIRLTGPALLFFNPQIPYTWEALSDEPTGFFCIFKEAFFTQAMRINLHELPMFQVGGNPAYLLNLQQDQQVSDLFGRMLDEIQTNYPGKYDLIRHYVAELIHSALKLQPSGGLEHQSNAKARLTAVFTELLQRQFPIDSPAQRFQLRSAGDFARQLSVHVNYLNRSVRETTGKTTTEHIAGRLVDEAKALLKHTDWNIAEIGYCLGFGEPAHFNQFFRKQTHQTPSAFRKV